jgi:uncharacterized SAM-binding protein YcdF (DUF218 family)
MARPPGAMTFHDYFTLFWRIALAAAFLVVTLAGAAFLFPQQVLTIDNGDVKADALVVLGGEDGRAEHAAELYHHGAAPAIVVTGYGDCLLNIEMLERRGVPSSAIIAEPAALSTLENATKSVPLLRALRAHRVIIVTTWYHSRRALACFEHVAPDMQFFSRPSYTNFQPKPLNRTGYNWHVNYEYVKLAGYWFSYGVCPL